MEARIEAIGKLGQSLWYDNLSRELLQSGALGKIIAQGVVGVTSNPTIFEKAITHGSAYDEQIRALVEQGKGVDDIYQALTQEDIKHAADVLLPVYEATDGVDGYVSLEVSPLLAHDTDGTVDEARRLFYSLGRKNVMIKVPATEAGIPAIAALIAEGINVNVTLIFGLSTYQRVMDAYLRGLEDRVARERSIEHIASVASFFVSRVDTLVDRELAARGLDASWAGKAAIANAKMAYTLFQETFQGERFRKLSAAGAMVQRPLWASTSTKNPQYPDLLYVDNLLGADTVNTVPPQTLDAIIDHAHVSQTVDQDVEAARTLIQTLAEHGITMDAAAAQLLREGVASFSESFVVLRRSLARKRARWVDTLAPAHYALGALAQEAERGARILEETRAVPRLWDKDGTLWTDDAKIARSIEDALGWLEVPEWTQKMVPELRELADTLRQEGFTDAVVLGMGGSSLVSEVLRHSFAAEPGYMALHVLDSTAPGAIERLANGLALEHTIFIVASKSGSTTEAQSFYHYYWDRVTAITPHPERQFLAITDPGTVLEKEGRSRQFRRVFLNPQDIGGRYSALSLFGMVPAALMGLDVEGLLIRAQDMQQACRNADLEQNPGARLGTILGALARAGHDKVTLLLPPRMGFLSDWVEQLLAESTGKAGTGLIPIAHEPFGDPRSYSPDRVFVGYHWFGNRDPGLERQLDVLEAAGHPVISLAIADRYGLAAEFLRWEVATALAGKLLGINPFDQPNVQESKENTKRVLSQGGSNLELHTVAGSTFDVMSPNPLPSQDPGQSVAAFLQEHLKNGAWLAVMAYVDPTAEHWDRLQQLRALILAQGLPSTVGFGPRFLHSTGQLHKGGPDTGVYLQIVSDAYSRLEIPGLGGDFGTLIQAQAEGDLESLLRHGRPVLRVALHEPEAVALGQLSDTLASVHRAI